MAISVAELVCCMYLHKGQPKGHVLTLFQPHSSFLSLTVSVSASEAAARMMPYHPWDQWELKATSAARKKGIRSGAAWREAASFAVYAAQGRNSAFSTLATKMQDLAMSGIVAMGELVKVPQLAAAGFPPFGFEQEPPLPQAMFEAVRLVLGDMRVSTASGGCPARHCASL